MDFIWSRTCSFEKRLQRTITEHNMKTSGRKSGFLAGLVRNDTSRPEAFDLEDGSYGEAIASPCGDHKGRVAESARPSPLQCGDCAEVLHELSNVITGVLLNAQVLEWKLPPYSHLKRSVREVERNAQRGSELIKRLQRRLVHLGGNGPEAVPTRSGSGLRKAPQQASEMEAAKLTNDCEPCTSGFFPKRDDGREG